MGNDINFLPEDYLKSKAQQRTNVICLVLFLLVISGVGAGFMVTEQRSDKMEQRAAEINRKMAQAGESLKRLGELEKKKQQVMNKASVSAMLMEPVPRSLLLATVTNNLPKGVSLLDYDLTSKVIKVRKASTDKSRNKKKRRSNKNKDSKKSNEAVKYETKVNFTGQAPTDIEVAQLLANLNESPLFSQVNLVYSEEHEIKSQDGSETVRRFKLSTILAADTRATKKDVKWAQRRHIRGM